jgi:hypothetical protein
MKSMNSDLNDQKGWRFIFRALSHRNYRLFFGGQSISLIGTWMQQIAVSWLAYPFQSHFIFTHTNHLKSSLSKEAKAPLSSIMPS